MTTRRSLVAIVGLLVMLVFPSVAKAEVTHINMGEEDGVDIHKDWDINFNEGVEIVEDSLSEVNIVVKDQYGDTVQTPEAYLKDENTIVVPAPEDGYRGGEKYKLYVGKSIEFESGAAMQDRYMKTFYTERDVLAPEVPEGDVVSFGTVTSDTLNIRKGPDSGTEKLGAFVEGDRVEIYGFDGYWAEIQYKGETGYVHKTYMKLRAPTGGVLQDQIIILDPGHGDHDGGASGHGGLEKEVNLDVSKRVKKLLEEKGADPIMTRETDTFLELSERAEFVDEHNGDLFVSIHSNAYLSSAKGTESFCYIDKSSNVEEGCLLAEKIHEQIVKTVGMYDRGVHEGTRGGFGDFHVIRNTHTPSVLVELGFLTNSGDAEKLTSNYYRDLFAKAIVAGIENYYKEPVQ
ncbi:N-acetylmuramoyl-L-alanine amidase [Halobacillus litoralis]|uniref:N-acetylmuramoyl-L-alanine amidase n=1 Tax=Halobacillus litoralis TaxID=45668 RepID=UPI001CD31D98|nr:N-acetylmuramoyl-L-alanine amidase [Halobacillus litoralis]MCA0971552.1 N-acetylmuramoyl-L-alanine amidase [Halobacillus litoralis]